MQVGCLQQPCSGHTGAHTWAPGLSPRPHTPQTFLQPGGARTHPGTHRECSGGCVPGTGIRMHRQHQPLSILPGTGPEPFKPCLQKRNLRDVVGKKKLSTSPPRTPLSVSGLCAAGAASCGPAVPASRAGGPIGMAFPRCTRTVLRGAGGWCSRPRRQPRHRGGSQCVHQPPRPPRRLLVALACCSINNGLGAMS